MPNLVHLIPSEGSPVSEDCFEGSGAFNTSFGGGLRGLPLFFGMLREVVIQTCLAQVADTSRDSSLLFISSMDMTDFWP